jgi:methyl-accepting chemotaxis protein
MPGHPDDPSGAPAGRNRVRRTRILSRPADQFRTSLVPTVGAAVMLVLLLAAVNQLNDATTRDLARTNPGATELLEAQSLVMQTTLATGAIFYLFGVLAVGLIHSRRLMGALFAMHRRIRGIAEGDLAAPMRLRRNDYFHDVADSINDVVSGLRMQAQEDLADVNDLLAVIERSPYAGPLRDGMRESLEQIRDRKRLLLGLEEAPAGRREEEASILAFPR